MVKTIKRNCLTAIASSAIVGLFVIACTVPIYAIARGYTTTDDGLSVGMVAALGTDNSSQVERADQTNSKKVVGVVTTSDTSSVTLASGEAKVLLESEGEVDAYVSDMKGEVTHGSLLVLSPLKGILMKANDTDASPVIAIAAESVTGDSEGFEHTYSEDGKSTTTKISKIRVNLNQQGLASAQAAAEKSALAKFGEAIVGKEVGEIRVAVALVIFVIVLIAEGGIIYGAITSAITALGRNPMARQIIKREMLNVILVAIAVLILGLGAVYGVLWV